MMLNSHTRLGLQAVLATSLTILISNYFHLGHGFWATITVLFLLSNTWSEGLEKGLKRVLMTVLGCLCGWLILSFSPGNLYLHLGFIFALTFLSCFFITSSYSSAMFTMTVLVVIMLDLLGQRGNDIFIDRIVQTAMGAVIVFIISRFVFPVSSTAELKTKIHHIFFELNRYLQFKLKTLKKNESYHPPLNEHIYVKMVENLSKAKGLVRQLSYERYFKPSLKHEHYTDELKLLTVIAHSIYSIIRIDETIEKRLSHEDRLLTLEFIEKNIMPQWTTLSELYGLKEQEDKAPKKINPPVEAKPLISLTQFLAIYQKRGYTLEHPVLLSGLHYYLRKLLRAINNLNNLKS